jgi:mannosyltransferase
MPPPAPVSAGERMLPWSAAWAARLERLAVLWFALLSVAYWAITLRMAQRKLFWNDELYTYYIAHLPTMSDVWAALMARGEQMPPLSYVPTRVMIDWFGSSHIAMRVPEMAAFWVMSACLFIVLARRSTGFPALCAAAFPLVTMAYFYAFEARPYALVLGASALALLCWQSAAMERRRSLAVVGYGASLALAVCSHYYGAFVLGPFVLGEAVRLFERRRPDWPVWTATALSVVPLAFHLPLIRAGADYSGAFWSPPQWLNLPAFYEYLLAPAIVPVTAVLLLALTAAALGHAREGPSREPRFPLERYEVAAALGFLLIPLVAILIAKLATGAFVNRYALPAVIGLAVLAGAGVGTAFRNQPVMRLAAAACLAGWFVLAQAREWLEPTGHSVPFSQASVDRPAEWIAAAGQPRLPIVIADPHTFTVLWYYSAPEVRERLVYAADPQLAMRHLGHNSVERGMVDLVKPWFGMNVVAFERFSQEHDRFFLYGDFVRLAFLNWIPSELRARGMRTELLNRSGDTMLLLVSRRDRDPLDGVEAAPADRSR